MKPQRQGELLAASSQSSWPPPHTHTYTLACTLTHMHTCVCTRTHTHTHFGNKLLIQLFLTWPFFSSEMKGMRKREEPGRPTHTDPGEDSALELCQLGPTEPSGHPGEHVAASRPPSRTIILQLKCQQCGSPEGAALAKRTHSGVPGGAGNDTEGLS